MNLLSSSLSGVPLAQTTCVHEGRAAWKAALRSGRFRQITGCMEDDSDGRCCLGVACDVYMQVTGRGKWQRSDYLLPTFIADTMEIPQSSDLPKLVRLFLGVRDSNPDLIDGFAAAVHNDKLKSTFVQIADLIPW